MPASGRLLIDTNIVIALLEGDEAVLSNLDEEAEIFIPASVLGEVILRSGQVGPPY
jgi:predicted nucleic acid-binding protein